MLAATFMTEDGEPYLFYGDGIYNDTEFLRAAHRARRNHPLTAAEMGWNATMSIKRASVEW
jgi:hypothetical protein